MAVAVDASLEACVLECAKVVDGAEGLAEGLLDIVEWRETPRFWPEGRSSWVELEEPRGTTSPVLPTIRGLKLKGVGLGDAESAVPPSAAQAYHHENPHIGITNDGDFVVVEAEPAPLGGIFLDRAEREFRNAALLLECGCPSVAPVAVYEYRGLSAEWSNGRRLGAVLTASSSSSPMRADVLLTDEPCGDTDRGRVCTMMVDALGPDHFKAVNALAFEYGRTLRQFHEAGLFRHNAFPHNYYYDSELQRVVLIDLDSSRPLAECGAARRPLEILRDVASGVYNLGLAFLENAARYDPSEVGPEPFASLLAGYFDLDSESSKPAVVRFLPHFSASLGRMREHADALKDAPDDQLLLYCWMNRAYAYTTLICDLVPLFVSSPLAGRFPLTISADDLAARVDHFIATRPRVRL